MPFHPAPPPGQQTETVIEAVTHVGRAHRHHPCRGQLDAQRDPVQTPADFRHRHRVGVVGQTEPGHHRPGPFHEQRHRRRVDALAHPQRRHHPQMFGPDPHTLPARRQHLHRPRTGQHRVHQFGRRVEHMLTVVEHHQQATPGQRVGHTIHHRHPAPRRDPQRRGHRVSHRARVTDRGQLHQPYPVRELGDHLASDLHRQAGLADPSYPGQRHQPMRPHRRDQLVHLDFAADEARHLQRQVSRHRIQGP